MQPINHLSGQANAHSVLAVLYAIINLHAASRLSTHAIQVASLVNDNDAKLAGMDEVINGGTTSVGAQLRRLQTPTPIDDPFAEELQVTGDEPKRHHTVHAVAVSGDFPAIAALGPWKGSVSAHCYDRKSTLDQRSEHYGKPFSLLKPTEEGFRRLTVADLIDCVNRAAQEKRKTYRAQILGDMGLNAESFVFNDDGTWEYNFALARIPHLDWLNAISYDAMHTSLLGTVTQEIYQSQYMFIVNREYYSRVEVNQTKLEYKGLPPGAQIPDFAKYVEEGQSGKKPSLSGRAKFSASQARTWLEHGTSIMEILFTKKVRRIHHALRPMCLCVSLRISEDYSVQDRPRLAIVAGFGRL